MSPPKRAREGDSSPAEAPPAKLQRTATIEMPSSPTLSRTNSCQGDTSKTSLTPGNSSQDLRQRGLSARSRTKSDIIRLDDDSDDEDDSEDNFLPIPVLQQIYSYLDDVDRTRLALVSRACWTAFQKVGRRKVTIYTQRDMDYLESKRNRKPLRKKITTECCFVVPLNNKNHLSYPDHFKLFGKRLSSRTVHSRLWSAWAMEIRRTPDVPPCAVVPASTDKGLQQQLPHSIIELLRENNCRSEQLSIQWRLNPDEQKADLICEMHAELVEQLIRENIASPRYRPGISIATKLSILILLNSMCRERLDEINWHQVPSTEPPRPCSQPPDMTIKLYEYQLRGLAWLKKIESNALKTYEFSTWLKVPGMAELGMDMCESPETHRGSFLLQKNWNASFTPHEHKQQFRVRGGIFSDEMGLGKTVNIIALALARPRVDPSPDNALYPSDKVLFHSKATLVVCAPHLVAQWVKEITSKSSMTVLRLSTLANIKSATYQDLLDRDVIVISYSVLTKSPKYISVYDQPPPTEANPAEKFPRLHMIGWQRLVVDEAHEIHTRHIRFWSKFRANYRWYVSGTPFPNGIESFKIALQFLRVTLPPKLKWVVNSDPGTEDPLLWMLVDTMSKCIFMRRTKEDVALQTDIPSLTEHVEWVELSPVEMMLHEAAGLEPSKETLQREICSNPLSASLLPDGMHSRKLSNIPLPFARYHIGQLNHTTRHLDYTAEDLATAERRLDAQPKSARRHPKSDRVLMIEKEVRFLTKDLQRKETVMKKHCHTLALVSPLLPPSGHGPCALCSEEITLMGTTPCEHHFCSHCITLYVHENKTCPTCSAEVNLGDLTYSRDMLQEDSDSDDDERVRIEGEVAEEGDKTPQPTEEKPEDDTPPLERVRLTHGSKMAAVAEYLLDVVQSPEMRKVIVFSQYNSILDTLHRSLLAVSQEEFERHLVFCKGNIHIRTKKLQAFSSDDPESPRILMLSLRNSASGTQLEAASHVLLLDPVVGTREEAQAIDAQAVARSHRLGQKNPVEVVRFIAGNTVEQKDYEKVYGRRSRMKSARSAIPID